ncbi:hypothetical protein HK105_204529 [Polyrhizophydium stewartii]|uniref:Eukaryotic translation initiation factor 2A n=1 Tax=Polyrhizophydium stewartii TaxID=2732419 RepID=A0ABR4N8H7_9FUNG
MSTTATLAYRDNAGVTVMTGPPAYAPVPTGDLPGEPRSFLFSPLGKFMAFVFLDRIVVSKVAHEGLEVVRELAVPGALEIVFSPRETHLSVYVRYNAPKDPDAPAHRNVSVWNLQTGEEAVSFTQKNMSNWNVQWAEDESYCARLVGNEIQFYEPKNFSKGVTNRLKLESISAFSMSPGKRPVVAVFVPEKNGKPGSVKLFDVASLTKPLSEKSFFRADTVQFHWNSLGTNVLVFTHTDVDATGQSYYGETNLYYLSITGNFDCKVDLNKPGPIHDVCWSPNAKEFVVVYGTMPAKATLFDHRASALYEFGSDARNQVKFNPHGRLLFIGGFGNLAGDMDVWDRRTLKKLATIHASNSSSCDWSPDGRHIMTSTLYRRLKVDNGIKIWHFTGVLVHKVDVKEMYETAWKFDPSSLWPDRAALSPPPPGIVVAAPPKPAGKYRPPGARNNASTTVFYDRDAIDKGIAAGQRPTLVPGAAVPGAVPGSAIPGAKPGGKKGNRKGAKNGDDAAPPAAPATPAVQQPTGAGIVPGSALESEKKLRQLQKKLRQIEELKQKQAAGQTLELTQIQKIQSEDSVRQEIEKLQPSLE